MSLPLSLLICLSVIQLGLGDQPVEEVIRAKNKPLLGSWVKRNPDSAEVQEAAQHAVKMFNEKLKGKKMFKLIEVTDAQSQVTNVINYKIDAVMGKPKCSKSENQDLKGCSAVKKHLKCRFVVTYNPATANTSCRNKSAGKLKTMFNF